MCLDQMVVPSLFLLSGLRIQCRHELWWRSQTQLTSCFAVAVIQAGSYSSDLTPSLGTSIFCGCGPKKQKKKKQKNTDLRKDYYYYFRLLLLLLTVLVAGPGVEHMPQAVTQIAAVITPYPTAPQENSSSRHFKRIIGNIIKKLYANTSGNLDKMDKLPERHKLPKLT